VLGNVLAAVKAVMFGSGLLGKVAALLAVAGATTVVASHPLQRLHRWTHTTPPAPALVRRNAGTPSVRHAGRTAAPAPAARTRRRAEAAIPATGTAMHF